MAAPDLHTHSYTVSLGPSRSQRDAAVARARRLNVATIGWNSIEGFVAVAAGIAAGSASLVGFKAAAGVLLTLAAQLSMGDSWRIRVDESERTAHVTEGAFRVARNPILTAMVITAIGLTMMVPNPLAIAGLAALLVALELQVRCVEEPYLRTVHGSTYLSYASHVGRFLPHLGRLRPTDHV